MNKRLKTGLATWWPLAVLLPAMLLLSLYSQAQDTTKATGPAANQNGGATPLDRELAARASEELAVAEARLKARQAEVALATVQLEEARRINEFNQRMFKNGNIPDATRFASEVRLSSRQADLAHAEAEAAVAQIRVEQARRRALHPEFPPLTTSSPLSIEEIWRQLHSLDRDHDHRLISPGSV
jgi:hypothetical protein